MSTPNRVFDEPKRASQRFTRGELFSGQAPEFGFQPPHPLLHEADRRALWNRPSWAGMPPVASQNVPGCMSKRKQMETEVGRSRVHRRDQILDPVLGGYFACGRPPHIPRTSFNPVDQSRKDVPIGQFESDPAYARRLYVDPFFGGPDALSGHVPAITGQQLYANQQLSLACG